MEAQSNLRPERTLAFKICTLWVQPGDFGVQKPCPAPLGIQYQSNQVESLQIFKSMKQPWPWNPPSLLLWSGSPQAPIAWALPRPCSTACQDLCIKRTLKQSRDIQKKKGKCNTPFFPSPPSSWHFCQANFAMTTASWMPLRKHWRALTALDMQVFDF